MKKVLIALALATVLLMSWVVPAAAFGPSNNLGGFGGFGGNYSSTNWGTSFYYQIGEGTVTAQLIAGDTGKVGTITVWESLGNINVEYETAAGYTLTKTALYIGRGITCDRAESQIPQDNKGNYDPSQFDKFQGAFNPVTNTYTVAENTLKNGTGNWLCIAAYAQVQNSQTMDAWGDLKPVADWKLPVRPISLQINAIPGTDNTYADLQLSNVPGGLSVGNGIYSSWCANCFKSISFNATNPVVYPAMLYSSLNLRGVPGYLTQNTRWDMINYIINHTTPETDPWDVQLAIWNFTGGVDQYDPQTAGSLVIIADAVKHGTGFVPGAGQLGAVIVDPGKCIQPLFIELCAPTTCCKESSCRYECNSNWSPCKGNWEPQNSGCSDDDNPRTTTQHCGFGDNFQNSTTHFVNFQCRH